MEIQKKKRNPGNPQIHAIAIDRKGNESFFQPFPLRTPWDYSIIPGIPILFLSTSNVTCHQYTGTNAS
jgi:hypothetical protein